MRPALLKRLLAGFTLTLAFMTAPSYAQESLFADTPEPTAQDTPASATASSNELFAGAVTLGAQGALTGSASHTLTTAMTLVTTPAVSVPAEHETLIGYVSKTYGRSRELASKIVSTVYREASKVGVPPLLAMAIIEKESGFLPEAQNASGATGLMQVMGRYHTARVQNDPTSHSLKNPETNIRVGLAVLTDFLRITGGDLKRALTQYSGGSKQYAATVQTAQVNLSRVVQDGQRRSASSRLVFSMESFVPRWCAPAQEDPQQ